MTSSAQAPDTCFHCSQPLPSGEVVYTQIGAEQKAFCCRGCAGVCEVIHEAGLQSFYQRRPEGDLISPPPAISSDSDFFDFDEVQSQFVSDLGQVRQITLMSNAIHCAACIWLIEHSLAKIDAIQLAKVNFTNKQIKLRWDNSKIKLSQIIHELNRLGYDAVPYDASSSEAAFRKANRDLLYRLGYAGFAMMNSMWFAVALYSGANTDPEFRHYFHLLEFIIATTVLLYSAKPFFSGALVSLRSKNLGMDVSISLGILVTYFYSLWVTLDTTHTGSVYFDTMIDFVFLLLIGRYVEIISKNKAIDATKRLMGLQPKVARLLLENGEVQVVPVRSLVAGQQVQVKPGDQFPVDGVVVKGQGLVNESMLSGESREINKFPGEKVSAGTINLDGALTVEVVSILQNTQLGRIVSLVEEAQGSKTAIQCTAEKVIPWFILAVISLATLSFTYWIFADGFETAMIAAASVLIITCPCAFGLATPMATAVASGVSAQHGILIKNGAVLEVLDEVDHFVFDKTGTLTEGNMKLVDSHLVDAEQTQPILQAVATIESHSEHSIAKALSQGLIQSHLSIQLQYQPLDTFQAHAGKGVEAQLLGQTYLIGTANWLADYKIVLPSSLIELEAERAALGQTAIWVAQNNRVAALLFVEDKIRPDAFALIERLKARGKAITLLSGDRRLVAEAVAQKLGGLDVIAEVLPEDKNNVIQSIQASGQKVAMVGDGINDAPALVRADVGIALGSGTDVSMDSADIVLLNNELLAVDTAVDLSARTLRTIKQNIASSIIYNIIMVPLAMAATLTPLIAAITMPISSLIVVANAARIKTFFSQSAIAKRRSR